MSVLVNRLPANAGAYVVVSRSIGAPNKRASPTPNHHIPRFSKTCRQRFQEQHLVPMQTQTLPPSPSLATGVVGILQDLSICNAMKGRVRIPDSTLGPTTANRRNAGSVHKCTDTCMCS